MSFKLGGVDTATLAGVDATLQDWPSLGGLSVEAVDLPAGGRFFGGSYFSRSAFEFLVDISGPSPAETLARQRQFIGLLDPGRGPRALAVEGFEDWVWRDVIVTGEINWSRLYWLQGVGYKLTATVTLETVGGAPEARESSPVSVSWAAPTAGVTVTLDKGNTASYPTLEIASGLSKTITVGAWSLVLAATPGSLTNVLDYDNFDFYQRNAAGDRVRSLVPYMAHFDRPRLELGVATPVTVEGGSTGSRRIYLNARLK